MLSFFNVVKSMDLETKAQIAPPETYRETQMNLAAVLYILPFYNKIKGNHYYDTLSRCFTLRC